MNQETHEEIEAINRVIQFLKCWASIGCVAKDIIAMERLKDKLLQPTAQPTEETCKWKRSNFEKGYVVNPHTNIAYKDDYCNICGKRIEVVE